MKPIQLLNAYRYVALSDVKSRQTCLTELCGRLRLTGYIVLSPEGIEVRVAGEPDDIQKFVNHLTSDPVLTDLPLRTTRVERSPFRRMIVRVKNEMIRLGVADLDVLAHQAASVSAAELRQWLDEKRSLTLLDVRSRHEVDAGRFEPSQSLQLNHFHELPQALSKLSPEMKLHPLIVYCTDALRSRKAAALLAREGFGKVYELAGGLIAYQQHAGRHHIVGEIVDMDPRLSNLGQAQSSPEHGQDVHIVPLEERHARLRALSSPLPGSAPRDQIRPITVPADCDGNRLIDVLCRVVIHAPERFWQSRFAQGLLLDESGQICTPDRIVRTGERFLHRFADVVEPDVNLDVRILHEDESLIVVNKPAPLPMHSGGRFHRNTLMFVLDAVYAPQKLRPAHRLDANTTGLLVIARSAYAAKKVQTQFARGEVDKRYLVRVIGRPSQENFVCDAPISVQAGEMGSRFIDAENGQRAQTRFRVLQRDADGTALLEAQPMTGRTNQIRVHLWHLGYPVVGDSVYLPDHELGDRQTLDIDSPPMCLHAWQLTLKHPLQREQVTFTAEPPEWANASAEDQAASRGLRKN